jgi:hypothetical protein
MPYALRRSAATKPNVLVSVQNKSTVHGSIPLHRHARLQAAQGDVAKAAPSITISVHGGQGLLSCACNQPSLDRRQSAHSVTPAGRSSDSATTMRGRIRENAAPNTPFLRASVSGASSPSCCQIATCGAATVAPVCPRPPSLRVPAVIKLP